MENLVQNDVLMMSNPIVKIEEVSVENLDMLNNSQSNFTKVVEDFKSLKVTLSEMGELEPIQVVKRGNKFQVVDGISRVNFMIKIFSDPILSTSLLDTPIPQVKFLKLNKSVTSK